MKNKETKLRVFDFDDTLVSTNSVVRIKNGDATTEMSPREFAVYNEREGDVMDFSDFDKVKGPKVKSMMYVFKRRVEANKGRGVVVLTARDPKAKRSISGYLRGVIGDYAMRNLEIVTLGSSDPLTRLYGLGIGLFQETLLMYISLMIAGPTVELLEML